MISLVGGELYQWDTGRIVKVVPDDGLTVHEVHFTTKRMDYAYVLKTYTEDGVTYCAVPNIILQQSNRLLCYEVCQNSDGEETVADTYFDIIKRNRPEDYVYTEQEHFTFAKLENRLDKVEESVHTHENKEQLDTITETDLQTWRNPNSSTVTGGAQVGILFKDLEVTTTLAEDASEWTAASSKPFKCTFRPSPGQTIYAKVEGLGPAFVTIVKTSPKAYPLTETIVGNYSVVNSRLKTWYNWGDSNPDTPNDTDAEWCFVFDNEDYGSNYLTPGSSMCTLYTKAPGTYKVTITTMTYSIDPLSIMKMYDVRPRTLAEYGTYANWKDMTKSGKYDLWEVSVKKTDYYNGVYLKEVSGTKYVYLYHAEQKYDSDSGTFTNIDHTLTYDTATETVTCSDDTLNPETDIIISVHLDEIISTVPDKATSLGQPTPDKVGKMLTAVDAGGTYNKWQNSRYQYQWVDVPETKTFYADFDVRDGKNIITKVTPDEIVAAYESGQNVIARIVSQLYMSGYVTLVRPFIIDRNREISFSDVVVFGSVTSGKMVQLYYDYDSKKWYFDISDWLLDKKHADEKYIDGYWGTDVAGKYLAISDAGVVYAANPPSGSSNNAVTYTEQTLTDDQKAEARNNIGALATSDILEVHFKATTSGLKTTWSADKTYAEIKAALTANKTIIGSNGNVQFGTVYTDSVAIYFTKADCYGGTMFTVQVSEGGVQAFTEYPKSLFIRNASVGQIAKIKTVDDNGAPTSWESTNLPTVPTKVSAFENDSGYLTEHQSLEAYAKKTEIPTVPTKVSAFENDSGYLTEHQSLEAYAKKTEIPTKTSQLTNDSGYLTEHQSLEAYAKKTEIPTKTSQLTNDSGYLTEHQSLEAYAKKTEIPTVPTTDSELSATSTNPVQNKIIKAELDKKLESIPVDGTTIKLNDQGQLTLALSNANGVSF